MRDTAREVDIHVDMPVSWRFTTWNPPRGSLSVGVSVTQTPRSIRLLPPFMTEYAYNVALFLAIRHPVWPRAEPTTPPALRQRRCRVRCTGDDLVGDLRLPRETAVPAQLRYERRTTCDLLGIHLR